MVQFMSTARAFLLDTSISAVPVNHPSCDTTISKHFGCDRSCPAPEQHILVVPRKETMYSATNHRCDEHHITNGPVSDSQSTRRQLT